MSPSLKIRKVKRRALTFLALISVFVTIETLPAFSAEPSRGVATSPNVATPGSSNQPAGTPVAKPTKHSPGATLCSCACFTKAGEKWVDWTKNTQCGLSNGKACRAHIDGAFHDGKLVGCVACVVNQKGMCMVIADSATSINPSPSSPKAPVPGPVRLNK